MAVDPVFRSGLRSLECPAISPSLQQLLRGLEVHRVLGREGCAPIPAVRIEIARQDQKSALHLIIALVIERSPDRQVHRSAPRMIGGFLDYHAPNLLVSTAHHAFRANESVEFRQLL